MLLLHGEKVTLPVFRLSAQLSAGDSASLIGARFDNAMH
jgi:hypothetical protein